MNTELETHGQTGQNTVLKGSKSILAVASGKGGVGKT